MDTEVNRESNVRLEPETKREIEKSIAESSESDNQTLLELYNQQIAVLEKDREGNKELLEQYCALREKLEKKTKGEENK